jgi:hypothetical protein
VAYLHGFTSLEISCCASNFLFFLIAHHLAIKHEMIVRPQPAMITPPPVWYRGSWLRRKKYGVNQ